MDAGRTIASGWESYNSKVLPQDAGEVQRSETRRAFYAGAWWCLLQVFLRIGEGDVSEDAVAWLTRMAAEIEVFEIEAFVRAEREAVDPCSRG